MAAKTTRKRNSTKKTEEIKETVKTEEKTITPKEEKPKKQVTKKVKEPKYKVGSIVYVKKEVEADLNGFNLSISQYKKETYTVEAYNDVTGVYTLRHLKLLLKLKEADIMAPDERANDMLNRKQF